MKPHNDIHKTQLLIPNNHPKPKHNHKYWRQQNIGADKTLAATKYWRRQNIGGDKILVPTKYPRQQKLMALTKYRRRQNIGVDKILASTKCKEILLRLRQHFVDARFLSTQDFFRREIFVDARLLSTRVFCRREYFVNANNFCQSEHFCRRQYFVGANILSVPIFLSVFRCKNDYLLLMIVFCVYHDYY
jgi:hypothetical protein